MELLINGTKVVLSHKPITLRNAEALTEWARKCKDHVAATNKASQETFFVDLMNRHPDLLDVLTVTGDVNPKALETYIERERTSVEYHNLNLSEGESPIVFDAEKAQRDAVAYVQKTIQGMMKDSPSIAKILQFTMPQFGDDLESLKLGIDCIIATYDDSKFDADQNAAIKDKDSDHWLDASAVEVATYVNNFLQKCA
jgi:hypothetical protein